MFGYKTDVHPASVVGGAGRAERRRVCLSSADWLRLCACIVLVRTCVRLCVCEYLWASLYRGAANRFRHNGDQVQSQPAAGSEIS